jgi:hypothetical protein
VRPRLIADPLLLDEATAALDSEAEEAIREALGRWDGSGYSHRCGTSCVRDGLSASRRAPPPGSESHTGRPFGQPLDGFDDVHAVAQRAKRRRAACAGDDHLFLRRHDFPGETGDSHICASRRLNFIWLARTASRSVFAGASFYINFAEYHEQLRLDDRGALRKWKPSRYKMQRKPHCRFRGPGW